jgi:hypothetical protein
MSKAKIYAIAMLLSTGFFLLQLGAPRSTGIFSRQIGYINQTGQVIRNIHFQAGREAFDYVNIPPGGMSSITLGRWSAYEVTVSGTMEDGRSFGPEQFMLPSNTISRNCTVRIRPNGSITLNTR